MKIMLNLRRSYLARLCIFLVVITLVVGTAGCGQVTPSYELIITSTAGGNVTTPGEGTFTYDEGDIVNLVAEAEEGYGFVNWTGDVSTIVNINAASTNITIDGDYSITANFEEEGESPIYFADPNLEAAIREAIDKPTGDIYPSDLAGLTFLDAHGRNVKDLTGLEYCTGLTELRIHGNQISNISPLANLTNLSVLNFLDNQISNISPLANLTNLTYLELYGNQISNVSHLTNLTNLTQLGLGANQISNISPLANLTNLTELEMRYNQISDISPLTNLTNLTDLYLDSNQVSDISPAANLTDLTRLDLGSNQISDISPLASLTSLTELDLHNNEVSSILTLANLTNLMELWLNNNHISDISPLVDNAGVGEGDEVDLTNNPLSVDSINIYIPQLEARGVYVSY